MQTVDVDVAIVGFGMSGIFMARECLERGMSFVILEKTGDLGGTWRDNRYPGLFVDIPASAYQYDFAPKPDWTHAFAPGSEIQDYLGEVADLLDLRSRTELGWCVESAAWKDGAWSILATDGRVCTARAVVFATGFLHRPTMPTIAGMADFRGDAFHSSAWPDGLDLEGKRVGVIGSGSSGVQITTALAAMGIDVVQFIRTPQWIEIVNNPKATAEQLDRARSDADYAVRLRAELEAGIGTDERLKNPDWKLKPGSMRDMAQRALMEDLEHIDDLSIRAALTPDFPPGCKRIPKSVDYFRAVQQTNVGLYRGSLDRITEGAVVTADGKENPVDVVVYATGFDTHAYMRPITVRGLDGRLLDDVWGSDPFSYRGISVPGFPNMFLLHGPYSPVNNVPVPWTLEHETGYIMKALEVAFTDAVGVSPTQDATDHFLSLIRDRIAGTVWSTGCDSWYRADPDGVPIVWPWFEREHAFLLSDVNWLELERVPARPKTGARG
jgi:cation diffusion facilitator CzcD-associated flavoprotein CzcO